MRVGWDLQANGPEAAAGLPQEAYWTHYPIRPEGALDSEAVVPTDGNNEQSLEQRQIMMQREYAHRSRSGSVPPQPIPSAAGSSRGAGAIVHRASASFERTRYEVEHNVQAEQPLVPSVVSQFAVDPEQRAELGSLQVCRWSATISAPLVADRTFSNSCSAVVHEYVHGRAIPPNDTLFVHGRPSRSCETAQPLPRARPPNSPPAHQRVATLCPCPVDAALKSPVDARLRCAVPVRVVSARR